MSLRIAAQPTVKTNGAGVFCVKVQIVELKELQVIYLLDHPKNPRVMLRQDVVDGIACQLKESGEFSQKHALHVRPVNDGYQILSGHHRKAAAVAAGLSSVWCWVESMDDDTAFMALVLSNSQGELDPLEIGIHAFEAVPLSKGGRGKKGGLSEYAEKIGRTQGLLSQVRNAGEVAKHISHLIGLDSFLGRAQHLSAIHKLPREVWQAMAQWIVERQPSVEQVKAMVDRVAECCEAANGYDWFPLASVAKRCLDTPDFSRTTISACVSIADTLVDIVNDSGLDATAASQVIADFEEWLRLNTEGDSWNRRKLQAKCDEIQAAIQEKQITEANNWRCGDWRDFVHDIEDASVNLLLIDPPYGMDYQSNRRKEKHSAIDSDGTIADASDELLACLQQLYGKLATNAHVLCFCRFDSEATFAASMRIAGLKVKGSCIWVKDNHGSGDLAGGFAPKHERIIHAVKGSPVLYERHPDVFSYRKCSSTDHPTEKPIDLLSKLIECTTVEGHLVVDVFAGVASTLVAAKGLSRKWFGCEINSSYYQIGRKRLGMQDE